MQDWATWRAVYNDETAQNQKDEGVSYDEIDRTRLVGFEMMRDGAPILSVPFNADQGGRLVWRRRVLMHSTGEQECVYIVGKRGAFVAALFQDGRMIVDDKFREDNALLAEVEMSPGETDA